MSDPDNRSIVERMWAAFDARDWDAAAALLHPEIVVEWPVSNERIRGRANVIAVNRNYPEDWGRITVHQVLVEGDRAASHVSILADDRRDTAVSFYEFRDGLIVRETDWWPEPYAPPPGRARWVEPIS